jgi:integrase
VPPAPTTRRSLPGSEASAPTCRWTVIAHNPCSETELPKVVTRKTRILTPDEFDRRLAEVPERDEALALTAIESGLRWGELIALRPLTSTSFGACSPSRRRSSRCPRLSPTGRRMIVKPYPKDNEPRTIRVSPAPLDVLAARIDLLALSRDDLFFPSVEKAGGTRRLATHSGPGSPAGAPGSVPESRADRHRDGHAMGGARRTAPQTCRLPTQTDLGRRSRRRGLQTQLPHRRTHGVQALPEGPGVPDTADQPRPHGAPSRTRPGHELSRNDLFFPSTIDRRPIPLSRNTFRTRCWRPALARADITFGVRMHDLRHAQVVATSWRRRSQDRDGSARAPPDPDHAEVLAHAARRRRPGAGRSHANSQPMAAQVTLPVQADAEASS